MRVLKKLLSPLVFYFMNYLNFQLFFKVCDFSNVNQTSDRRPQSIFRWRAVNKRGNATILQPKKDNKIVVRKPLGLVSLLKDNVFDRMTSGDLRGAHSRPDHGANCGDLCIITRMVIYSLNILNRVFEQLQTSSRKTLLNTFSRRCKQIKIFNKYIINKIHPGRVFTQQSKHINKTNQYRYIA